MRPARLEPAGGSVRFVRIGMFEIRRSDQAAIDLVERLRDELMDPRLMRVGPTTRLQTVHRPAGCPPWAWGFTYGRKAQPRIYIRPDSGPDKLGPRRQLYASGHEPDHVLDMVVFTAADRHYIKTHFLNRQDIAWRRGHYDTDYCEVPREGAADGLARAMAEKSGVGQDFDDFVDEVPKVLAHYFQTRAKVALWAEYLDWTVKRVRQWRNN